jgi:hypothetical protein
MMPDNEVGRMLRVDELVVQSVVVLSREDRPHMFTAWVSLIGADYVAFTAGEIYTTFLAKRHPDGRLTDDTDKRILVFEYLGEV